MSKTFFGLIIVAIALFFASPMLVKAGTRSNDTATKSFTAAAYKTDRAQCDALMKLKKERCIATAKADLAIEKTLSDERVDIREANDKVTIPKCAP